MLGPDVDPSGNPELVNLNDNIIVDVTSNLPAGMSVEQNLPVDLDGKAIPTTHRHYGNADADKMFGERTDTNSPLQMERNPVAESQVAAPSTPQYGTATGSFTEAGAAGDSRSFTGNSHSTPPPGAELGSRAPDTNLFSADRVIPQAKDRTADQRGQLPNQAKPAEAPDFLDGSWTRATVAAIKDAEVAIKEAVNSATTFFTIGTGKMTDPDAAGGTVVPTAEQLTHAVAVHGGATDFVQGYGGRKLTSSPMVVPTTLLKGQSRK